MASHRILVIGSSNTDMVTRTGRLPGPGETVLGGEFRRFAGGKGANQAVAARRAGGEVTFLAAVGDDSLGRDAVAGFEREGIDTSLIRVIPGAMSGVALIMVDRRGENMITVAPGANASLRPEMLEGVNFSQFGTVLLQLEIPLDTVAEAARLAREAGAMVILNPAPALELPEALLANVDILTPNRGELALMAGEGDVEKVAAEFVARHGLEAIIVTMGSEGVAVIDRVDGLLRIAAPRVTPVDTVGAGDCFNGVLSVGLSEGMSLGEACQFAVRAASLSVTRSGAQDSMPKRADIL